MARIETKLCEVCRELFPGVYGGSDTCSPCRNEATKKARDEHFAKLDAMSMEDRLRRVEEWIYNYRPPSNKQRLY